MISNTTDNLSVEIDQLANVLGGRIIVVDSQYKIIKDTYTIEQDKYMLSEDVFRIMKGEIQNSTNQLDGYVELMFPIVDMGKASVTNQSTPTITNAKSTVETNKQIKGVIIATVSTKDIDEMKEDIRTQGYTICTLFIFIAIILSLILSLIIPSRLKALNRKIKHMSEGHLDETLEIRGFTELNDLTESFNQVLSKIQVLEASRQEFVSNVSHELKTPITSMKVLADSLILQEDVPNEMYREFMQDIADEIDRESKIINDLLTLIKLDKKAVDLNIAPVNINGLLELLLKRLRPLAAKRNIEVIFESMRDVTAEIDEVKLSLAFSNLIENAIKYNDDNGWVRVSLNADHKFFYVKVADSGVGIPQECQDQVFERFYRVDKARTRETGGTGLGLAITRNAVLMHKGAIKLYSEPGEGTTFTVRIPLTYIA